MKLQYMLPVAVRGNLLAIMLAPTANTASLQPSMSAMLPEEDLAFISYTLYFFSALMATVVGATTRG